MTAIPDRDFCAQLTGFSLTTAEILYRMPDHPSLLQSFIWQEYDVHPRFPRQPNSEIRAVPVPRRAGFHPLVLVLRLEVTQEGVGEVDVLREVPDTDAPETRCRLTVLRAPRRVDMVDHLGDRLLRTGHQY